MKAVNLFIKLLGKNYYTDLIAEVNSETIDFDKYYVLVNYKNTLFYELSTYEIGYKRDKIISEAKEYYQEALTEIYAAILSHDSLKINTYLDFNAEAIKTQLNILKRDFYIDEEQSRYYSEIDDNPKLLDLSNKYHRKLKKNEITLSEDITKLFNSAKHKNFESIYDLEYLYERNKMLSLFPFSLFVIGQQFIIQLEKIKSKINPDTIDVNTESQSKVNNETFKEETYFESFLLLLDNNLVLKKYTAIGIMVDFNMYINEIKSEVLTEIQTKGESRNDYLDYLINEIEKQHYIKNADISYVQKWLDEYKITIDDIFDMKYQNNAIRAVIDIHYMDMDKRSEEKQKAHLLQSDFRDFFCKYYADELIFYIKSKKDETTIQTETISDSSQYPKNQYLNSFIDEVNNVKALYDSTFIQCYEYGILHFAEYLKVEINENILRLPKEKNNPYLDLVKNKLISSHFYFTENNILDKWIDLFGLQGLEFPFLENNKVNKTIKAAINNHLWDEKYRELMEDIQLDFFYYAAMTETKKIIAFLDELTPNFQTESNPTKRKIEINPIFKSLETFEIFNFLIEKFDITKSNIKKRGVQAQLNAIWGSPKSKKEIFKEHAELKDYVIFLNDTYQTDYKSRTMSDGSKYHNSIKEWLN